MKITNEIKQINKKLSPFNIILKDNNKSESYRVNEKLFNEIRNKLTPYRSYAPLSKSVRCIETGEIFKNAYMATVWLVQNGITNNYSAYGLIKAACKKQKNSAYRYHWEFVEN